MDTTLAIWTYTWEKLPELDNNGVKYVYTVAEIPVPGYTASVEGGTITNQLDALDPGDPTQLTVTYVYNNGQANASETVNFGNTANGVADPTWEGHAFKGWYTDNGSFANAYDFTTPVTENITLYAKWVSTHDGVEDLDDHHFITFVMSTPAPPTPTALPSTPARPRFRWNAAATMSLTRRQTAGTS